MHVSDVFFSAMRGDTKFVKQIHVSILEANLFAFEMA